MGRPGPLEMQRGHSRAKFDLYLPGRHLDLLEW